MITNRSKCVLFLAVCKKDASLLTTSLGLGRGVAREAECVALNSDASPPPARNKGPFEVSAAPGAGIRQKTLFSLSACTLPRYLSPCCPETVADMMRAVPPPRSLGRETNATAARHARSTERSTPPIPHPPPPPQTSSPPSPPPPGCVPTKIRIIHD